MIDVHQCVSNLPRKKRALLVFRLNGQGPTAGTGRDRAGIKRLIAYVVPRLESAPSIHDLRRFLWEHLPEYMVPSTFVLLDAMPRTPNGKVDRRALPESTSVRAGLEAAYTAPRSELERMIGTVWQEVLRVEKVGVHDNFFDLGGHSLLMVRLHSKLQDLLKTQLSIVDLFKYPTVSAFAQYLSQQQSKPLHFQHAYDRAGKQQEAMSRQKQRSKRRTPAHE